MESLIKNYITGKLNGLSITTVTRVHVEESQTKPVYRILLYDHNNNRMHTLEIDKFIVLKTGGKSCKLTIDAMLQSVLENKRI